MKNYLLMFVLLLTSTVNSFAQSNVELRGKVTDATTGKPIQGVSVKLVSGSAGTTTTTDGTFVLKAAKVPVEIQFTSIGYVKQIFKVANEEAAKTISIQLANADSQELNEVVVTALGIKKEKKSLSYNVQELKGEQVSTVKTSNFVNSLQGKVAGVTINTSSTGLGGGVRVVVRGTKSLSGNNNALYVIDGIPMPNTEELGGTGTYGGRNSTGDAASNINPEDIESISVLSGPAAAALYGSDAANGAVVINTKKGSDGKLKINLYNNTTFSRAFLTPKLQNEYGSSSPGAFDNWGLKLDQPANYDPKKDFFQTGHEISTGINISGGNAKNQTFFSAAMLNGAGIIPNNKLTRYNFTLRNTSNYFDNRLQLDYSAMYINTQEQNMLAQGQYSNPLLPVYLFPRGDDFQKFKYFERYDPVRNINVQYWPYGPQGISLENPYWQTNRELFNNYKNRYILSAAAKFKFTDWLSLQGRAKLDRTNTLSESKFYASTYTVFSGPAGNFGRSISNSQELYSDLILNLDKDINSDFHVNANLGGVYQNTLPSIGAGAGGYLGLIPNLFTTSNIAATVVGGGGASGYLDNPIIRQSALGSAELSYRKLLYLSVTGRNDWTSTLANTSSEKSGFFYPSVGLSAVLSDIKGFKNNYVNFLKVRGSYAEVGNGLTQFTSIPTYGFTGSTPQTTTYGIIGALRPERTKSIELGINSKFLDNKLSLDITLYKSNTFNQLFSLAPPPSSPKSSYYINAGNIANRGIEALLGYDTKLGAVSWNSTLTFTLNRNKIIEMLPSTKDPLTGEVLQLDSLISLQSTSYKMVNKVGHQMGDLYVNTLRQDNQGNTYVAPLSGSIIADNNNFIYAGNVNPRFNMGFRNEFNYKGVGLGFVIDGRFGGVVISQTQATLDLYGASQKSADERTQGGVLINGSRYPDVQGYYQVVGNGTGVLSQYVYSATNVRLRELFLNYVIPGKLFKNKIQNIKVGITARNLFMMYNKAPFDPELISNTGTYGQGVDYFMQPSLRSYGFSISVNF